MPGFVANNVGRNVPLDAGSKQDDLWLLAKRLSDSRPFACSFDRYVAYVSGVFGLSVESGRVVGKRGAASCEKREMLNLRGKCLICSHPGQVACLARIAAAHRHYAKSF